MVTGFLMGAATVGIAWFAVIAWQKDNQNNER